ncbi:MAG: NAD(P)-dependent glycerol-3-phosphate dehydrogenase [Nitrospirae bacterium]|nr:NAD(P)-dependent glycerol-3-phosphate dehydrogenase [Nitrospirota bacterium]
MDKISIIGAGSWGTALSGMLAEKGLDVTLWAFEEFVVNDISTSRINKTFLPEYTLPANLNITSDLKQAVTNAAIIILVVPTQFSRAIIKQFLPYLLNDVIIVSASKGLEKNTLQTQSQILKQYTSFTIAVLSGPSFAKEVIRKLPTAVTIAVENESDASRLQEIFTTDFFRVYTNNDIIGVELGGSIKNVMAIASGISDGLGLGLNARAALITRGLEEMGRLGAKLGANPRTFSGLSGLGDLILTCTANMSRNYTVGFRLGKGEKIKDITNSMKSVAEGVETSQSVFELSKKLYVEMPIVEKVYNVIYNNLNPAKAVRDLMSRNLKSEFFIQEAPPLDPAKG